MFCTFVYHTGVDPMGLFWSMVSTPGLPRGQRLSHFRATAPRVFDISVVPETVDPSDYIDKKPPDVLAHYAHERFYKGHEVKRVPIDHPTIKGTLFIPKGT